MRNREQEVKKPDVFEEPIKIKPIPHKPKDSVEEVLGGLVKAMLDIIKRYFKADDQKRLRDLFSAPHKDTRTKNV